MPPRRTRSSPEPPPPPAPSRRGWLGRLPFFLRWPLKIGLWLGVLGLIAAAIVSWLYSGFARNYDLKKLGELPERSVVLDVRGSVMGRLHGENRIVVPLDRVSPHFVEAVLAREDDRFYKHDGIDNIGLLRALVRDVKDRSFTQGASTLTMQLARNSFAMSGKSLHRKLLEMALARRIEGALKKDEILALYLNRIFFGTGIFGVERASQAYFGKQAADLTLDESAMLAAIIRGPNKFSPFRSYDVALSGRDMVLDRMVAVGRLSAGDAAKAKTVKTRVMPPPDSSAQESYALDAVRRDLDRVLDAEEEEDGGLRIYTTIDMELQRAAETAVDTRLTAVESAKGYPHQTRAQFRASAGQNAAPEYLQAACCMLENETGRILAVVGGRDYADSPFNRALLAQRQVGSTFKPLVYAAAIQNGLFPTTLVDDGPVDVGGWRPHNSDNTFGGREPAEFGLYKSRNTMTVRVGEFAGLEHVTELAERAGLGKIAHPNPQLYIGNVGSTPVAVTSAYSAFANSGERMVPFIIDRIENREGDVIYRTEPKGYRVLTPGASWCITKMLEKVLGPGGTAATARTSLGYKTPAAGKTGTTDDFKDAWFVGYHRHLTCGVWVGLDQPERIAGQGYGSKLALPIWVDAMKAAEKMGYKPESPVPDVPTEKIALCRGSGLLATTGCESAGLAVVAETPIDLIDHLENRTCADHPGGWRGLTRTARPSARGSSSGGFWDKVKSWFR